MTKLYITILSLLFSFAIQGQNHAFVLVDVSGSIPKHVGNEGMKQAQNITHDILMGKYKSSNYPSWTNEDVTDSLLNKILGGSPYTFIGNNSLLGIIPFGNKQTVRNAIYNPNSLITVQNFPSDFENFFSQHYPIDFRDGKTYIALAQAQTVPIAQRRNIDEYYLFVISDGLPEHEDETDGNPYDADEERSLQLWGSASGALVKTVAILKRGIYKVSIRKVQNATKAPSVPCTKCPPVPVDTTKIHKPDTLVSDSNIIQLTSYSGGAKNKPKSVTSEKTTITWSCKCPIGTTYTATLSPIDGNGSKVPRKTLQSNSASYDLEDGLYKVIIASDNASIKSDVTYIEVNKGGGNGIFILLGLLLLGAVVYFIIKNQAKQANNNNRSRPAPPLNNPNSQGQGQSSQQGTNPPPPSNNPNYF